MINGALTLNEVIQQTELSRDMLLGLIKCGQFPPAIPLGPWTNGWSERDVKAWLLQNRSSSE